MTVGQKDSNGLPLEQHIPNIVEATQKVLEDLSKKHGDNFPEWMVIDPPDRPTGIPREIFSHIMHCDFAIADISNASPNVMYEVAILHANGTPVICLGDPVFYLNQQNCIRCASFEVADLKSALSGARSDRSGGVGQLESMMRDSHLPTLTNPITEFFHGVHFLNVAATAGIAAGNFYNFIWHVLREGGIFKSNPDLKKLLLIRPENIKAVTECRNKLEHEFGQVILDQDSGEPVVGDNGEQKKNLPVIRHKDEMHPRGEYFAHRIGNYLVDYPAPILSLSVSKQYKAMNNYYKNYPSEIRNNELIKSEKRLIKIYFDTLEMMAHDETHCDWDRVKIVSVEEAIKLARMSS